ncbi:MAG: flagellar biosynthetic protein FliO [Spirochaetes bacterium]|nr:flagellar biosynthetic protein FliO [Spirochaetota bacterium]MBU1081740.1 flagellar biosynthetic protein FliO [Spirochaetota bacterium]
MDKVIRLTLAAFLAAAIAGAAFAQQAPSGGPASGSPAVAATTASAVDETTLPLAEGPAAAPSSGGSSILPYFFRMVLVLALVIAAIYGLYALLKRSAKPAASQDSYLRVLASTNLAVGRTLHVVSLGDKAWLVGSTDSAVGLISEIQDKELIDALALRAAEAPESPRKDFGSMLGELLGNKGRRKPKAPDAIDFFSRQKDRLKKF